MKNYVSLLMILMLAVFSCNEKRDVSLQKCWSLAERGNDYQIFYNCDDDRLTLSWFGIRTVFIQITNVNIWC